MNNQDMLDFLMEQDVILKCGATGLCMMVDSIFVPMGEFVVYRNGSSPNDD